jgi:hypothetical protein
MSRIVQEKYQVDEANPADKDPGPWKSDKSARTRRNLQGRTIKGLYKTHGYDLNKLPPGMNIQDQEVSEINEMRTVTAGTDDVTDNPSGNDFRKGFVSLPMRPTDDMYTREHNDAFYDEVTVDGQTGYLERNNMLDRS